MTLEEFKNLSELDQERIKNYNPKPIEYDNIKLPSKLDKLVDYIAENLHEQWAKSKMDAGWTYAPIRDNEKKHHPCLVPYKNLSEQEKEFDVITARDTLKFLKAVGYEINVKNLNTEFDNVKDGKYCPAPVEVSQVKLSRELESIAMQIAVNTHKTRGAERIKNGFGYATDKNATEIHANLVPWDLRSKEENRSDLTNAKETIQVLSKGGVKLTYEKGLER